MKAISGIFLAVLVVLIALSIAILAYIFFYKTFTTTAGAEEAPINTTMSKMSTGLEIEAAAGNTFYMRNTGTSDLKNFLVYVNGNQVSFSITPSVVPPNGVATITLSDCTSQSDVDINVVGPGVKAYHLAHNMAACGVIVPLTWIGFSNPANNTAVNTGTLISFDAQWSGSVSLSMYVNSSSTNGGGWTNGTWQTFAPGNWSNFTVMFPSQVNSNLTVMIYANDSSNNQSATGTWFWYNTTILDTISPTWSNIQSFTPSNYSSTNSEFNITWTDNFAVSQVLIETNFSGAPTNYSMTSIYGNNIYTFRNILPAGTFYWKSYANDTSNNWNASTTQTFAINKGSSIVYLYVNDSRANRAVSQNSIVNYTAQLATPATGNVELWTNYSNGVYKQWKTGASPLTNLTNMTTLGTWIWAANFTGNQNYSSSSETWYVNFIIPDTTPPTYSLNSTNSTSPGKPVQFSIYWTDNTQVDSAITSLWNGSTWVNSSSWCSIGAVRGWCNQTMVVNSTPQTLWWKVYANDSSNNWNTSQNFSLITSSPCDYNIFSLPYTYTISNSNKLYCLAQNIHIDGQTAITFASGIQNSTLDCQGYNLDSNVTSNTNGVYLVGGSTKNNTVKNCNITNFGNGIWLNGAINNTINNNNVASINSFAIWLNSSSSSNIISNNVLNNDYYGIWLDSSSSNTITNNTANWNIGGDFGIWISFNSNSNTLINNTANFNQWGGIGVTDNSNNNILNNNAVNGNGDTGFYITGSYNTLTNNNVMNNGFGIYIYSGGSYNNITGGTIFNNTNTNIESNPADYSFALSGTTNNFTSTNFTAARTIRFADSSSWFNYQNSSNIWLKAKVSAASIITRKLISWSQTLMQWNDTSSSSITATYNITGLLSSTNYNVYNNSVLISGSPFNSSSSGQISFTINLPAGQQQEIKVQNLVAGGLEYAQYNSTLKAPDCHGGSPCIANSSLLQCRDSDSIGEPNQPNTIDSCADLGGGTCHSSPSTENITVESTAHNYIGQGDTVRVNITYFCQTGLTTYVALFYTNSTTSINWKRISPTGATCINGYTTFSWTFSLNNTGGKHAVRGAENNAEISTACDSLGWSEHDDLAFDIH